ncbi:Lrp/AsnC family transcriptional regulator [Fimbriimonas ginsengisoli]|uniref:Transcriptional regulator, AsnC family n=1 Tax=Fimbriimonas ginsengisoli Gsoil 348 TaxID=661478 RepID=A0A068NU58_FIMGI|nr:Lrp/AsnC family transcriptional regulator [Fimbriimonas ginsengisoli]AIE85129.1 transcriptional regulator, AsnC family [Fimbriimonas ginsengisoli Gsoil 348]
MELDHLDHEILARLGQDGRATHAAIARELGMSGPAVYARVRRMELSGVIRGYSVVTDPAALGSPLLAIVRVTTRPLVGEGDSFEAMALAEPRVVACYDVDGEDSYVLIARCASPEDLRRLLLRIRSLPQVIRTVSSIALVTVKEPGAGASK